ncbi:uncharacterized protein BDZ99DRAFT_506053 [Mytilinidion resinicola]|uniref:Methyltransferase type 11 domain-containing protein n=1 Tax=Mytilinidion resinicola TaxID=574789 RepID=A0A6A6Z2T0_9PEZI|nr:uncharacterized protein BDZ99DRAFT_506053 [Mytilinidion resinicola]KAF2814574.1 hypothetical protein BDZ99DRAFT_506053 [Mytilinidion resinicola]
MASYKSQFNPPRRSDLQAPYAQRAPSTRLPSRSVTPTSAQSQIPTPNPSKLQKKKYTRDEQGQRGGAVDNQRMAASKSSITDGSRRGTSNAAIHIPHGPPVMSIPRSIPQPSSSRLPRLEPASTARTPSLVSGSSASTIDSPRSNILRRKQSSIGVGNARQASRTRSDSMSSQEDRQPARAIPGGYKDPFSETVLGISLPPTSSILARAEPELFPPERQEYVYDMPDQLATDNLPPPAPTYALSTTPSTRYSESPGPFSVTSTPTSMSSYSPGVALTTKPTRMRQASPMQSRPPVTRRTPEATFNLRQQHGLSSVRESTISTSSSSTVRQDSVRQKERERNQNNRLEAPPPSPPIQISSMYFTVSQTDVSQPSKSVELQLSPPLPKAAKQTQIPPELAHLADQAQLRRPSTRRPSRPSRDGTSDIVGLREPSPVIQSNMSSFPSPHKRTSSSDSKTGVSAPYPTGRTRFGAPSKPPSRNPSPNPNLPSGFAPVSRVPTRGTTPDAQSDVDKRRAKTLPAPAPVPSLSKTSRFGFFSRRTKTDPTVTSSKSDKKLQRKGPMAGTGHEGYSKYNVRGRSGSSASANSVGGTASAGTTTESLNRTPSSRKSSMTSTTSAEMDDFFLERLAPAVIRGTGSSELSRSPEPMRSVSSIETDRPSIEMRIGPNTQKPVFSTKNDVEASKPTLLPSAMSDPVRTGSPMKRPPMTSRRSSASDDESKRSFLPSLAARRTSRRSQFMDGGPLAKVPSPVNTSDNKAMNGLDSALSGKQSIASNKSRVGVDDVSESKEGNWLKSKKAAPVAKPTRKWNFFQRAHAAPKADSPVVENGSVPRPTTSRSVAHYALMDPPNSMDLEDLEQIMQEADSTPEEQSAFEDQKPTQQAQQHPGKGHIESMLLPSPPAFPSGFARPTRPASPQVTLRREQHAEHHALPNNNFSNHVPNLPISPPQEQVSEREIPRALSPPETLAPPQYFAPQAYSPPAPPPSFPPPRPSRLAQVGRIPQVVSRRDRDRKPPSVSFSRPFVPDQPHPSIPVRTSIDSTNSVLATSGPIESFPVLQGLNALNHGSAIAGISPDRHDSNASEFFKFPSRKDSELSYSSSSGIWSFPPTTGTAIIPDPTAPLSEDELWNEYDDLIDEVLSPMDSKKPTSYQSNGLAANEGRSNRQPPPGPLTLSTKTKRVHGTSNSGGSSTGPATTSLHLRRSRLLAVLHSAQTPTTPLSMSEFFAGYGERNLSVIDPVTGRLSLSSARMSSGPGPQNRPGSTRSSLPASLSLSARQSKATLASTSDKSRNSNSSAANRYRDTRLIEMAEAQNDGLVSMANLRFGALMTSKWLSFGRVLFSPAHFELKDPAEDRVLVIDGLGKDWSYYCALTYPEATVYNLGPGVYSMNANTSTGEPWSTLPNHRHIAHPSLVYPFPFPRGFFATVVLRFPAALPSSVHRSIVSECKRVLRPGGYLEISVLDLDLVNMGNRARRAVRGLKVRLQAAEENISLRNVSDEVMGLLGRRGFSGVTRCFVGVPVAGHLPTANAAPNSDGSNSTATDSDKTATQKLSFSDLLNSPSPSDPAKASSVDDGIAEMVARVGRWWYSRCYEAAVLPTDADPAKAMESSIWSDEALIRECEKRGTSFRLLIGYAQKPVVGVRRTVSV